MPLYTICATDEQYTMRPCAIVQAVGLRGAELAGKRLKEGGRLSFLSPHAVLRARPSSRREIMMWKEALTRPLSAPRAPQEMAWNRRVEKLEDVLFQRMWRAGVG